MSHFLCVNKVGFKTVGAFRTAAILHTLGADSIGISLCLYNLKYVDTFGKKIASREIKYASSVELAAGHLISLIRDRFHSRHSLHNVCIKIAAARKIFSHSQRDYF